MWHICYSSRPVVGTVIFKSRVNSDFLGFISFFIGPKAGGILVPRPETEPVPHAVKVRSLNHWNTRDGPDFLGFKLKPFFCARTPARSPHDL